MLGIIATNVGTGIETTRGGDDPAVGTPTSYSGWLAFASVESIDASDAIESIDGIERPA